MQLNNIITNTRPVADSFVNDQLKWRRERIEKLTKERNLYKKTTSVRYSCENKTVEVSKNADGTNYIVRIIE